jgi:hypothetical protein
MNPDMGPPVSLVNTGTNKTRPRADPHPRTRRFLKRQSLEPDRGRTITPGSFEETFGAVTRERRRRWPVYRPRRFFVSTAPIKFFSGAALRSGAERGTPMGFLRLTADKRCDSTALEPCRRRRA